MDRCITTRLTLIFGIFVTTVYWPTSVLGFEDSADFATQYSDYRKLLGANEIGTIMANILQRDIPKDSEISALAEIRKNSNLTAMFDFTVTRELVYSSNSITDADQVLLMCSFDHVMPEPWCPLFQCYNDDGNWLPYSGKSPIPEAGPVMDHTGKGQYMMLTPLNLRPSQHAQLVVSLNPTPEGVKDNYCLTFWFSLMARDGGEITVERVNIGRKLIWKAHNQEALSSYGWRRAAVSIPSNTVSLTITGKLGAHRLCTISVDELMLQDRKCTDEENSENQKFVNIREEIQAATSGNNVVVPQTQAADLKTAHVPGTEEADTPDTDSLVDYELSQELRRLESPENNAASTVEVEITVVLSCFMVFVHLMF